MILGGDSEGDPDGDAGSYDESKDDPRPDKGLVDNRGRLGAGESRRKSPWIGRKRSPLVWRRGEGRSLDKRSRGEGRWRRGERGGDRQREGKKPAFGGGLPPDEAASKFKGESFVQEAYPDLDAAIADDAERTRGDTDGLARKRSLALEDLKGQTGRRSFDDQIA